jgi:Rod binding domain-containing protein
MSLPVSIGSSPASSSAPVVNQTLEPAWVRHGSASTQKAYQTALDFEQMLVEQLSQSMTATSGLGSESSQEDEASGEEGSGGSGGSPLSSMLPQALTSGVMNAGGLGLAAQMTRQLEDASGAAQAVASGGTAATPASGPGAAGSDPAAAAADPSITGGSVS